MSRRIITISVLTLAVLGLVGCRTPIATKEVIEKPSDVALIGELQIRQAKIIGEVSTGDDFIMGTRVEAEQLIAKLQEEAAAIGANALLMTAHPQAKIEGGKLLQFWYEGEVYTVYVFHHDNIKTVKVKAAYVKPYPPTKSKPAAEPAADVAPATQP